jgi:hypothetical protein
VEQVVAVEVRGERLDVVEGAGRAPHPGDRDGAVEPGHR